MYITGPIILGAYVPWYSEHYLLLSSLGILLSLVFGFLALCKGRKRLVWIAFCLILGLVLSVRVSRGLAAETRAGFPDSSVTAVTARVCSDSRLLPDGRYTEECRLLRVHTREGMTASGEGNITVIRGKEGPLSSGTEVRYAGRLVRTEEGECLFYTGDLAPEVLSAPRGLAALRVRMLDAAVGCFDTLGPRASGLLTALFLGIRDDLIDRHIFRNAGCSHILALSGMHVGIIAGFIGFLMLPLLGKGKTSLVLCVVILGYLFLTGFGESLCRSALMFFFITIASFLSKKPPAVQILGISFIVLSVISPDATRSLSFQLSFLALAGILVLGKVVLPALSWLPPLIRYPVSASLGAQLATASLSAAVFGVVYPVGLAASLVLTPVVTILMGLGMVFLSLSATGCTLLSVPLGSCIRALSGMIYAMAGFFSKCPAVYILEGEWCGFAVICAIIILTFLGYGILRTKLTGRKGGNKLRFTE